MNSASVLGYLFLFGLALILVRSFLIQQAEQGKSSPIRSTERSPIILLVIGVIFGGGLGMALFWPNYSGYSLPWTDAVNVWNEGGEAVSVLLNPWIIKTVICGFIGGLVGFVSPKAIHLVNAR